LTLKIQSLFAISLPMVAMFAVLFSSFLFQTSYAQSQYFEAKGIYLYEGVTNGVVVGGAIENVSDNPRDSVEISITLYDRDGNAIGTVTGNTNVDVIHPGQISSFETILRGQANFSSIDRWNMTITSEVAESKASGLTTVVEETRIDPRGVYFLEGTVTNNGNTTATGVRVSAAFYDQSGQVVASAISPANPQNLEPGQSAPFQLVVMDNPYSRSIASARLSVESMEYTIVPEFSIVILALFGVVMGAVVYVSRVRSSCRPAV